MTHDCQATKERLVDLLFDEVERGRGAALLEEVGRCAGCLARYRSLAETLKVFDVASEAAQPPEDFWPSYGERLRSRMSQEIRTNFWRPAARLASARGEYALTFLEEEGLARRLVREVRNVSSGAGLTWPEFKRDPLGFTARSFSAYGRAGWGFFSQRNVALATLASFAFVTLVLGSVLALERFGASRAGGRSGVAGLELVNWVGEEIPREQKKPDDGAAGTNEGKGGGSKPKYEKPGGGGGGGRNEAAPPSHGKLPPAQLTPQILTPNPKPPAVKDPHLATPVTVDVDPALIKFDPRDINYGDQKSAATTPSSGSGSGGGIGNGSGGGVGSGEGGGVGPGRGGNIGGGDRREGGGGHGGGGGGAGIDYTRPFKINEVMQRAVITYKPEPGFTEEARRNNVTGTVRLRAVLSASGGVTSVSVLKGLPDGLTEKAINAARQIKFRPAQKDGRAVSQYIVLEYNFNIY